MSETIEQAIIDAIEASDVKTADGLRNAVYRQVQGLGFDVAALVRAARDRAMEDAIEKLKKARSRGPHYEEMARRIKARPKVFPTEPTPERRRKDAQAMVGVVINPGAGKIGPLKAHRTAWVVDQVRGDLTAHEQSAAEWARWAWDSHHGYAKIGDYGGSSGGVAAGSRMPLTDEMIAAAAAWRFIQDQLHDVLKPVARNFVLQAPGRTGKLQNLEEFGREYIGAAHVRATRGASLALLRVTLTELARIHAVYPKWQQQASRPRVVGGVERLRGESRGGVERETFKLAARE